MKLNFEGDLIIGKVDLIVDKAAIFVKWKNPLISSR